MSSSVENERGRGVRRRLLLTAAALGPFAAIPLAATPASAFPGDNYPEPWRSAALGAYVDDWGYYTRYCTSWVAWALHDRNGFEMPRAIGDASNWGNWASNNGYTVNSTPAVGSVAWWNSNHVAWVEAVSGDQVTIQEYNYGYTGSYHRRSISKTNPTGYIHFKDIVNPPYSGWNGVGNATFLGSDQLQNGQRMYGNQYILSIDGRFVLMMQSDGNLVQYGQSGAIWASGTDGHSGAYLGMQSDGNIVIYASNHTPLWSTGQKGIQKLVMQSDGNLVARNSSNQAVWANNISQGTLGLVYKGSDHLNSGMTLTKKQYFRSSDKRYVTVMHSNGELAVYGPGWHKLWKSPTAGNSDAYLGMQSDGNMVIYSASQTALWATGKKGIQKLVMQSDGNMVARNSSNDAVWATNTDGDV